MQSVALGLDVEHTTIGGAELSLVESLAKALGSLGNLLANLLVILGLLVLDEHVGAVALLGGLVVDEGVVECIHVARSLPDGGVHEDS